MYIALIFTGCSEEAINPERSQLESTEGKKGRADSGSLQRLSASSERVKLDLQAEYDSLVHSKGTTAITHDHPGGIDSEYGEHLKGLIELLSIPDSAQVGSIIVNKYNIGSIRKSSFTWKIPIPESSYGGSNQNSSLMNLGSSNLTDQGLRWSSSSKYKSDLIQFINSIIPQASGTTTKALGDLRTKLQELNETEVSYGSLDSIVSELRKVLNQPRNSIESSSPKGAEIWVDTATFRDLEQRRRALRAFVWEKKRKEHVEQSRAHSSDPTIYLLSVHRRSHHNRLSIFKNTANHQVRITGVCAYDGRNPYMFSFACTDENRSMTLISVNKKKNQVADAALRALCYSKKFARYLVTNQGSREDRCLLSKWPILAKKAGEDELWFGRSDRKGRLVVDMLRNAHGCFTSDELDIELDCIRARP